MPNKLQGGKQGVEASAELLSTKNVGDGTDCRVSGRWWWIFDEGKDMALLQLTDFKIQFVCGKGWMEGNWSILVRFTWSYQIHNSLYIQHNE